MAYQQVRDDNGHIVCEYDRVNDTVRVKRKQEIREASLKDFRDKQGNLTDSNK